MENKNVGINENVNRSENQSIVNHSDIQSNVVTTITDKTTLVELLSIIGDIKRVGRAPTYKKLRKEAGEPIAVEDRCEVYANGYAVYDNGSGRTVIWLPNCTEFTYHFDPMKNSEKGDDIKQTFELPEGLLESLPWPIAVTFIGDHRVEMNSMNRTGGRTGTKDYDSDDNGDKDGDAEEAVEKTYRQAYDWMEDQIGENPETIYIRKETRREMLESMTEKQRKVFVLYYLKGYTQQAIADMLNSSQQNVAKTLSRAIEVVKKFF